ncbi:MAG: hypothetical protein LBV36_04110 [Chromatiales bacterium]|jgi:hypothetical protein|nr:hypothetical protein [Chromatiales bacterium]
MSARRSGRAAVVALLMICPLAGQASDIDPPTVAHTPPEKFSSGETLRILARVTDEMGVDEVVLFYRSAGEISYRQMPMVSASGSSLYSAILPDDVGPRIEYYIQASDTAGNVVLGKLFDPYVVLVEQTSFSAAGDGVASATTPSAAQPTTAIQTSSGASLGTSADERRGINRWVWVGIGAVVLAAIAGLSDSGGGGAHDAQSGPAPAPSGTGSVTINAPLP